MQKIQIFFKDETNEIISAVPTYGDRRSLKIRYEIGFVVITNSYSQELAYPSDSIKQVTTWVQ